MFFDNVVDGLGNGRVTLANEAGMRLLVAHLAQVHGHRRIGFLGGKPSETSGSERLEGYRAGDARPRPAHRRALGARG